LLAGWFAGYVPSGYIVYSPPNEANLFAVPFDLDRLEIVGEPVPLVEDVAVAAISDSGTLAYIPETASGSAQEVTLVWVNREGKEEPLGTPPNSYAYPKISPDGTRVALSIGSWPDLDIWIWDIVRKSLSKLTFEKTRDMEPVWAPDSKRIAYWADTAGASPNGVYLKAADGTGDAEKLISAEGDRQLHPGSWSSDGKTLLLQEFITWTNFDLCALPVEGDHTLKPLFRTEHAEHELKISPDGRWIAYTSNESEQDEVYVRPFPEVNEGKWQVSTSGGHSPLWSPDMRELFYLSEDNVAMTVAVETKPTLRFGTPKTLFKNTNLGFNAYTGTPWDIHPDGKRFLMMKPPGPSPSSEEAPRPKITIVFNWFEELKERVPVD
jgi:protease II